MTTLTRAKERARAIRDYRQLIRLCKHSNTIADYTRYAYEASQLKKKYNL